MTGRVRTFFDRKDVAVTTGVESPIASVQRNIAADGCTFEPWNIAQRVEGSLNETLARWRVRILRRRQRDSASPKILRTETNILLTQPHKTRDQQRRSRQQSDRERNLGADQNLAKPLLAQTSAGAAASFFQSVHQIRMRALERWIQSHQQPGQHRQPDGKSKDWK